MGLFDPIVLVILTRAANIFFGKYPNHPLVTGRDIYPVVSKTSSERISDIEEVVAYVNANFTYAKDVFFRSDLKTDSWNFMHEQGITKGDCEDFALTTVQLLLERGWSIEHLRLELGYKVDPESPLSSSLAPRIGHVWVVANWGSNFSSGVGSLNTATEVVVDRKITDRASMNTLYQYNGVVQIMGNKWAFLNNSNQPMTDEEGIFTIEPVPYIEVKQDVLRMQGRIRQKPSISP